MSWFSRYIKSSIGAKHIMAITGFLLVGFIFAHMAGNLQVFLGADTLNTYAEHVQGLGPLLWVARVGLIAIFLIHIGSALRLVLMNRAARPVKYKMVKSEKSSFASRTMAMSALIVLMFLVYHLMHFTFKGPSQLDFYGRHDVFHMVVSSFSNPIIAGVYMLSIILLCLHLSHGVTSMFQSLGLNHPRCKGIIKMAGPAIALLVLVGNCAMPIACLVGWIKVGV